MMWDDLDYLLIAYPDSDDQLVVGLDEVDCVGVWDVLKVHAVHGDDLISGLHPQLLSEPRPVHSETVCLFVCLGFMSLWNIWGHITTVLACSSGTLTNVLPHRNAMPQTQDMTPHPVTVYRQGPTCHCAIHWCGTSHWNTQLPILMSWVRPDREILPRPSIHTSEHSTWCCHGGQ